MIILFYLIIYLLIFFNGFISILGRGVSYFYLGVGLFFNHEVLHNGEPTWLAILGFLLSIVMAFWMFNGAEKRKEGSYMIPERVTINMSAYSIGSFIGAIWAIAQSF